MKDKEGRTMLVIKSGCLCIDTSTATSLVFKGQSERRRGGVESPPVLDLVGTDPKVGRSSLWCTEVLQS